MNDLTVHISAPVGRDTELLARCLNDAGLRSHVTSRPLGDFSESDRDSAGSLLIAEEALDRRLIAKLGSLLANQPHWSDLPILLLTSGGRETAASLQRQRDRRPLGHPTLLERPLRPSSLLSAVRSALDARKRQFELRDANEQRDQAFAALTASEQRSRLILESTHDCIKLLDLDGNLLSMNEEGQRRLGIDDFNSICGKSWMNLWRQPYQAAALEAVACARAGEAGHLEAFYETPQGEPTWWDISVTPVRDKAGSIVNLLAVSRESTGRKLTEQALIQSEKLAVVGRLAASISHEINNPLESITNLLYIALNHNHLPSQVKETLLTADQELSRVSQIVSQTLRFHRQSTRPRRTTAEELVSTVIVLYRGRLANSAITTEIEHVPDLFFTCFDGEIRQVLSNLVGNAMDAMRTGGRLIVRSHGATDPQTGQKGVAITVADTGHGMEPEVTKRIFEAFYSTKGDNGTGLGLWITKDLVERHHGHLAVRSKHGLRGGTVFRLFLPSDPA